MNIYKKYKKNVRKYYFEVNKKKDEDIINHLDSMENRGKYIRDLIWQDMQRNTQEVLAEEGEAGDHADS